MSLLDRTVWIDRKAQGGEGNGIAKCLRHCFYKRKGKITFYANLQYNVV